MLTSYNKDIFFKKKFEGGIFIKEKNGYSSFEDVLERMNVHYKFKEYNKATAILDEIFFS